MSKLNECLAVTKFKVCESVAPEYGVLATVEGTFAEYGKKNKNGRYYGPKPWKRTLERQDIQANLAGKRMFGELDHPEDYVDVKIIPTAFCITKLEMHEDTETIWGQLKILDTPGGKLLNTLVRFGSALGVSSRASGDIDEDGNVIPETYDFVTFDVVVNPSNGGAIPMLVESVQGDDNMNKLKQALLESIKDADTKTLILIENIAQSLGEESASEIINKVEERKSSLKESEITDEMIMERLTRIEDKVDKLLLAFNARFGVSRTEPEDLPKDSSAQEDGDGEIVESTNKTRARKRVIISEAQVRETPIAATRIVESAPVDADLERQKNIIKANKTK